MAVALAVPASTKVSWISCSTGDGDIVGFLGSLAKKSWGEGNGVGISDGSVLVTKVTTMLADG